MQIDEIIKMYKVKSNNIQFLKKYTTELDKKETKKIKFNS